MGGVTPSAFIHENTAAALQYAVNSKLSDPELSENHLIINFGQLGLKLSLVNISNVKENPEDEKSKFFPKVTALHDKFYNNVSGQQLDYCFLNYAIG